MSRHTSTNNVSLFPFLAVLVCAMGALILLLLVTTRRIRSKQFAAAKSFVQHTETETLIAPPELPKVKPQPPPPFIVYPVAGAAVANKLPPNVAEPSLSADWLERDRQSITQYQMMLSHQLKAVGGDAAKRDEELASIEKQRTALTKTLTDLDADAAALNAVQIAMLADQQKLAVAASGIRKDLEKPLPPIDVQRRIRIVPFDGASGTVRRPILIECSSQGFRFLPENVVLSNQQMEGFLSGINPLLSGATALSTFWEYHDRKAGEQVAVPYILLVVRPGGSLRYYAARRMLAKLEAPIGYELLTADEQLDLPIPNPEAARLCRLAVNRTLARQDRLKDLAPLARALANSGLQGLTRDPSGAKNGSSVNSLEESLGGRRTRRPSAPAANPEYRPYPSFGDSGKADVNPKWESAQTLADRLQRERSSNGAVNGGGANAGVAKRSITINPSTPGESFHGKSLTDPVGRARVGGPEDRQSRVAGQGQSSSQQSAKDFFDRAGQGRQKATSRATVGPIVESNPGGRSRSQSTGAGSRSGQGSARPPVGRDGSGGRGGPARSVPSFAELNDGKMAFQRSVTIHVDPGVVTVGRKRHVQVDPKQSADVWVNSVLAAIQQEIQAWGPAVDGAKWVPDIRFEVSPGAGLLHARMKRQLLKIGITGEDRFTLKPYVAVRQTRGMMIR